MGRALILEHEADIRAPADDVRACLLDPVTVARCVPGANLTAIEGTSMRGRIRIKVTAVPVQLAVQARLTRPEIPAGAIALDGHAADQRTGRSTRFRMRVAVTETGPGQARCRISGELEGHIGDGGPEGASRAAVADRLLPQFVRLLEEVAGERPDPEEADDPGGADEDRPQDARQAVPKRLPIRVARRIALVTASVAVGSAVGGRVLRRVRSLTSRP